MREVGRKFILVVALLIATDAAHAQTTLYLFTQPVGRGIGRIYKIEPDTSRLDFVIAVPNAEIIRGVAPVPDGSLLAWLGSSPPGGDARVTLWNPAGAAFDTVALTQPVWSMVGSPTRAEVYLHDGLGPFALSAAGRRPMNRPACGSVPSSLSARFISADGRRLGFWCADGYLAVSDTVTGAVVLQQFPFGNFRPALDRDGEHLYIVGGGIPHALLQRWSLSASAFTHLEPIGFARPGTIHVDSRTGEVFLVSAESVRIFDPVTLQPRRSAQLDLGDVWTFDPHQPRAYTATSTQLSPTAWTTRVSILDTQTLTVIASGTLLTGANIASAIVVAPLPAAPVGLVATVQGAAVQLTWSGGPAAATTLRYVVEAGSGPGLANLGTFDVGLQTSLTVGSVPPGIYYVRVRALNHTGASLPSNEVVVTVP